MPRYISADDFQVELHNMGLIDKSGWIRASITNMNIILAKCTADASPVIHGRWIGDICSECGKDALCDCDKYEIYGTIHSDYCPHCGAKMDK